MDHLDKQILNLLEENARISLKDIANQVNVSAPTVASHINNLEQRIIDGYRTKLNYAELGYGIKAYIEVKLIPKERETFVKQITQVKNILACDWVTGDYSMLLTGVFKTTIDLEEFIQTIQHFGETNTKIVISDIIAPRDLSFDSVDM